MPILDSGQREDFNTGSVRDTQDGKGRFDLLPFHGLKELAIHFQEGAEKYGERNWEKGQPLSRYMSSAARHLFQVLAGKKDEPHARSAAWNLLCFLDTAVRIEQGELPTALDDIGFTPSKAELDEILTETNEPVYDTFLEDDAVPFPPGVGIEMPEGFEWTGEYREPKLYEWFIEHDGMAHRITGEIIGEHGNKYILREKIHAPAVRDRR